MNVPAQLRLSVLLAILTSVAIAYMLTLLPQYDFAAECLSLGGKPLEWDYRQVCTGPAGEIAMEGFE